MGSNSEYFSQELYKSAVLNEYFIDKYLMEKNGIKTPPVYLRYLKFEKAIKKHRNFMFFLLKTVSALWVPFYKLLNYSKRRYYKRLIPKCTDVLSHANVFFVASTRSLQLLHGFYQNENSYQVLFAPWVYKSTLGKSVLQYATLDNIDYAYQMSKHINFDDFFNLVEDRSLNIQTYDAFEWFLLQDILVQQDIKELVFTNHYDRWAVLFDSITSADFRIQIQHGLVDREVVLPTQLKNITNCVVYNENYKKIFQQLYHSNYGSGVEYSVKNMPLQTSKIEEGLRSVLFVGSSHDDKAEMQLLMNCLIKFPTLIIYIKPHPVNKNSIYAQEFSKSQRVNIISDKKFFPEVAGVLSYQSTLGFEYEIHGTPVLYYEDKKQEDVFNFLRHNLTL